MSNILIAVLILTTLLSVTIKSQDFCESYLKNDHKVVVFSDDEIENLFLFVGTKYWSVIQIKDSLKFKPEDRKALNSVPYSSDTMFSYVIAIDTENKSRLCRHCPAFYNINTNQFVIFAYNQNTKKFNPIQNATQFDPVQMNYVHITFGYRQVLYGNFSVNVLIYQCDDTEGQTFKRWIDFKLLSDEGILKFTNKMFEKLSKPNVTLQILRNISESNEMIGVYTKQNSVRFVLFRSNDAIKYCALDQCLRNKFKVLVDCEQSLKTWIIIGIVVMVLIIGSIFCLGLCSLILHFVRKSRPKPSVNSEESSTPLSSVKSLKTGKTSKSGLPDKGSKSRKPSKK